MPQGNSKWLSRPEWDPDDEFYTAKCVAWEVLTDAIKKSVMCNDHRDIETMSGKVLTSPRAATDLIEARTWLLTPGGHEENGGITRDDCLFVLGISGMALFGILRGLWTRMNEGVYSALTNGIKRSRRPAGRQKRAYGGILSGDREASVYRRAIAAFDASNRIVLHKSLAPADNCRGLCDDEEAAGA